MKRKKTNKLKWTKPTIVPLKITSGIVPGCGNGSSAVMDCFTGNIADWCFGGLGALLIW